MLMQQLEKKKFRKGLFVCIFNYYVVVLGNVILEKMEWTKV